MASGTNRMDKGLGMASSNTVDATTPGKDAGSNGSSQGETSGAGSTYSAVLNERENLSNTRNRGPERAPSRIGGQSMPVVSMGQRNTGKIG